MHLILILLFIAGGPADKPATTNSGLSEIRNAYIKAIEEASAAKDLHQQMQKLNSPEPLKLGYKGAAKTLKAKHSWNPYKKATYLKNGMALLTDAIERKPADVELRFLRLSVAYYLPGFLGYDEYVEADRRKIVQALLSRGKANKPEPVLNVVLEFLFANDLCTEKEQEALMPLKS